MTWLVNVVTCEGTAAPLASLLDRVVACSPEAATDVLDIPGVRVVVMSSGNVLRSWSVEDGHQASSVSSVHVDYEEACTQAEAAQAHTAGVSEQLSEANTNLNRCIHEVNDVLKALYEEDAQRAEEAQELTRTQSAAQATQAEAERAHGVARHTDEQVAWAREQDDAVRARLDGVGTTGSSGSLEGTQTRADIASRAARETRGARNKARLSL